jgi:hypothetical protein
LVVEKPGEHEAEKANSMFDESVGPQVVMGILREPGGVKAERAAVGAAVYDKPMVSLKGLLLLEIAMAGDACGVSW